MRSTCKGPGAGKTFLEWKNREEVRHSQAKVTPLGGREANHHPPRPAGLLLGLPTSGPDTKPEQEPGGVGHLNGPCGSQSKARRGEWTWRTKGTRVAQACSQGRGPGTYSELGGEPQSAVSGQMTRSDLHV